MLPIRRNAKSIGLVKRILIVLLVVVMTLCLLTPAKASEYGPGEKTNDVEIYVGYFGELYAKIADVTEAEMENNMVCGEYAYSSIDNGGFTRYNLAYGVHLDSLLNYVDINTNDVDEIYFLGTDNDYEAGFYNLFGVRHFFYPYLGEGYNREDPSASNTQLILSAYDEVPSILAFTQSLARDSEAYDEAKYRAGMSDTNCLRIVFGQTKWNEISTSDSVKWVYRITVKLKGSPIKVENMNMEYGSEETLKVTVDSGYEELDEVIRNDLNIFVDGGSDKVELIENDDGSITVKALDSGNARIMVVYESNNPNDSGSFAETIQVSVGDAPGSGGGDTGGNTTNNDDNDDYVDTGDTGGNGSALSPPDEEPDDTTLGTDASSFEQQPTTPSEQQPTTETKPTEGTGTGSGTGSGGDGSGSGSGNGNGTGQDGSGTGSVTPGTGSGGSTPSSNEGSYEQEGGTSGDDLGRGDASSTESGDADRIWQGMDAAGELVPLSGEGEDVYNQIQGYMAGMLEQMEEVPDTAQITDLTGKVREYIMELIEQMESEDEPLDMDAIVEMVKEYIDELLAEDATEEVSEAVSEEVSEDNASEDSEAAKAVYLSLGNVSGGGTTSGGSVAGGGTSGGSGGKMLDIEELPTYYYVILIVALAALFVGGGTYRSLRFRRETAR